MSKHVVLTKIIVAKIIYISRFAPPYFLLEKLLLCYNHGNKFPNVQFFTFDADSEDLSL